MDVRDFGIVDNNFSICNKGVFGIEPNVPLLHEVVKWQLAKRRLGTRATKGISNIKATTRKPYKQKGTGRARLGSLCSTQCRGGAIVFGPVYRKHSFNLNKKVCKKAVKMALSSKLSQNELFILNVKKLSKLQDFVDSNGLHKVLLILTPSCRSLFGRSRFNILMCQGVNVYDIIKSDFVFLTRDAADYLNKRFI